MTYEERQAKSREIVRLCDYQNAMADLHAATRKVVVILSKDTNAVEHEACIQLYAWSGEECERAHVQLDELCGENR